MLLAGDLGATNTRLGLFQRQEPRPVEVFSRDFSTKGYPSVAPMILELLAETTTRVDDIEAACIGAAGPVIRQRVHPTNISWYLDAQEVIAATGLRRLHLLNDVEVMAHSVSALLPSELHVLQQGTRNPEGNAVLLTAGTGLGTGMLINIDGKMHPSPSEGGHADFAARTGREVALLNWLTRLHGRAHVEHIVSGPGLVNLLRFVDESSGGGSKVLADAANAASLPARITQAALDKSDAACVEALDLFLTVYGAASGNLAMTCMATGGVYLGGGIPPRILPAFDGGQFMAAFLGKSPMDDLMHAIPVSIILNDQAGLLGAAVFANNM
jgi:glucokinase